MNVPNTYSQLYVQIIFAVKGRESIILPIWEDQLFKYITGIVSNKGQKLIAINGMPDHIHILIGLKPSCQLSDLVREIKKASNSWINEKGFVKGRFAWQSGYGAFSYSNSSLQHVINYIKNQKKHHSKKSFKEEYTTFLQKFEVDYKEEYLFNWIEI